MISLEIINSLKKIKEKEPLIHCITNYITANDCANVILAIGASPTMADALEEVEEMAMKASALVINLGIITNGMVDTMIKACKSANNAGTPIVFDPVGVGATTFRREAAFKLLKEVKFSVIRGNMAEIKTLSGLNAKSKGVDSIENVSTNDSKEIAKELAKKLDVVVAITGQIDYISDGQRVVTIENGNKMLTKVTGTGCMTTALIGAYLGGNNSSFISSIAAVSTMGIAGEIAFEALKDGEGSGAFRVNLIDAIYNFSGNDIERRGKINE